MQSAKQAKILLLGTQMEVAGAQRMLLSQARWFDKHGYEVKAVFFYDKQGLQKTWQAGENFPVLSLDGWGAKSFILFKLPALLRALWALFVLLRSTDVVITYTPHSNLLGLPLAWLARVQARIGTHHGFIEGSSGLMARVHGWLTNSWICSAMVSVSAQVKDYAIRKEGARPERIIVIENGIDPAVTKANSEARALSRAELGLKQGELMLLTVGRLTIQKGHTVLLDAIAQLAAKATTAKFFFAGDGPQKENLTKQVTQLGISERVAFLGVRNDIGQLLSAADVFVQPSLWEGLSLALLEALFAGLPVIATMVEGVVDVVEDGKSALLVKTGDAHELAKAIEQLIADEPLRRKLAVAGNERAKAKYSIDTMCGAYEKLFQSLLNG
jgi:glycosyltransferase involved in cell wall biosynthesis